MQEWNDLVFFDKKNATRSSEKTITLYLTTAKTVNMAFNSSMAKSIEEEYMNIAYSKQRNAIVIFFSNEEGPNSYKLMKRSRGCTIPIQKFLNSFNLDKQKIIGKYKPLEDIINDKFAWIINLRQEL
jgi:hypothetical protein